jgi:hypothetical protein
MVTIKVTGQPNQAHEGVQYQRDLDIQCARGSWQLRRFPDLGVSDSNRDGSQTAVEDQNRNRDSPDHQLDCPYRQ